MSQSEVARLLEKIELENQAAVQALYGLAAGVARHDFITARMEHVAMHHEALKELVGEKQAAQLLVEALEKSGGIC